MTSAWYRVSQEKGSIIWEVIVSVILSKEVYMYMHPISNGFQNRSISLYTVQASNTPCPHKSCKVHWCWRSNFRKCNILGKLYQLCHLNNKYWYQKQYVQVIPPVVNNFGTVQWNSSVSDTARNRTRTYTFCFAQDDRYYDLPEYWPFLLGHPVSILISMTIGSGIRVILGVLSQQFKRL
jgi:hypothetical protein